MMRSMYSGVSGLKVHQTKMDVIGNNIANVNTIGFRASIATFSDILYQTTSSASGPNPESGRAGVNSMQIGLGASLFAIAKQMNTSGGSQRTDNPLDLSIEGDGFFVVNDGTGNCFTKAGAFTTDAQGVLTTASGHKVMGWQVDPNDPTKTVPDMVSELRITSPENMYVAPEATTAACVSGNIDSADTQIASETGRIFSIAFYDSLGQSYMANLRVTQSADDTSVYGVTVSDILNSAGKSIFVTEVIDEDTGEVTYESSAITTFSFGGEDYDVTVEADGSVTIDMDEGVPLNFNGANGAFVSVGEDGENPNTIPFKVAADPDPFSEITIDFSSLTMYAGTTSIEGMRGDVDGLGAGKKAGTMIGTTIDESGNIYGVYDNDETRLLGQIVIATFPNAAGLEAIGSNLFKTTQNSGDFDGIGEDVTVAGGSFTTGVIEMSNVDLASQFTDMITTQRGFQANSRIITTSDTLLEELINLKR